MTNLQVVYKVNDESTVIPEIPYENGDELIHTEANPICPDPTCPCKGSLPTNATSEDTPEDEEVEDVL